MAQAPPPQTSQAAWPPALVAQVHAEVETHRGADQRERRSRADILRALTSLERPLDRHGDRRHVTGSAVVVGRRGTVLHLHKRLGRWLQPGGHLEPGEAPWQAARREAEEETGLALAQPSTGPRLIHVDVHSAADDHVHLDLRYLLFAGDEDPDPPPGESPQARWFTWDEAVAVADDALAGALSAARRAMEE